VFGEGAPDVEGSGNFNENRTRPYTAQDIRFTTKGETLYAFALGWPADGKLTIRTLAAASPQYPRAVGRVEMLGVSGPLQFTREATGLVVTLPEKKPNEYTWALKIQRT
jgi:alpha-L-fucosidase